MMQVRTRVQFSGVPKGTEGVAEMDDKLWKVTWKLPFDSIGRPRTQPLMDWFNQEEFDQFLDVI